MTASNDQTGLRLSHTPDARSAGHSRAKPRGRAPPSRTKAMMTSRSITAGGAEDYAEYLDPGNTVETSRGDYYLGADGQPAPSPGRWLASDDALRRVGIGTDGGPNGRDRETALGRGDGPDRDRRSPPDRGRDDGGHHDDRGSRADIDPGPIVERDDLVALMQGVHPQTGESLRGVGRGGRRNAGVDLVLGAPKSVSVVWAIGRPETRAVIEAAHDAAVRETFDYLRSTVPVIAPKRIPQVANDWYAAAFTHTTSRAVKGRRPDPHLHTHIVVTSALGSDGRVRAIRDRALYRAGREGGAYYRAALAANLADEGFAIRSGTGNDGRYFELDGIPQDLCEELSGRHRELVALEQRFEAAHGRRPTESEMSIMEVDSRAKKLPHTEQELREEWSRIAEAHGVRKVDRLRGRARPVPGRDDKWADRVEDALTVDRATFGARELRAVALEQGVGKLRPAQALGHVTSLAETGRIISLEQSRLTTRTIREMEQYTLALARAMAGGHDRRAGIPAGALDRARVVVSERLGAPLSREQEEAIRVLSGPQRLVALEGNAGSGKGVILDVIARAEQEIGRTVMGVAVAGKTHHRLAEDSPTLRGNTLTAAALLARTDSGTVTLDANTTVIIDEAGMVDTPTFAALLEQAEQDGARVVLVGDRRQLDPVGAGGMLAEVVECCPLAKVAEVHRTQDPAERTAWAELRRGKAREALAHYLSRGQLHLADERQHALHAAAHRYHELAQEHGYEQVALMTDGANSEVERMNARVQHLRLQRGEIAPAGVPLPDASDLPSYALHVGDTVTWRAIQFMEGEPRIENGTKGAVVDADIRRGIVRIRIAGSGREVVLGQESLEHVRLGYASSVYRQQGVTVDRAVALTGGWQSDRASAYVQASRARRGIDWFISREDLGEEGTEQVQELARRMSSDHNKTASVAFAPALYPRPLVGPEANLGPEVDPVGTPLPESSPAPADTPTPTVEL